MKKGKGRREGVLDLLHKHCNKKRDGDGNGKEKSDWPPPRTL